MRRIAILVIAASKRALYRHYIATHWTDLIRYTAAEVPHIDVFLLPEPGQPLGPYRHVRDHVIIDPAHDLDDLVAPQHRAPGVPGILSKTVHALDVLAGDYDVFFRTNLSSIVMTEAFDRFVQQRPNLRYSGAWVWTDALRDDLLAYDRVGPGRAVETMSDLDAYPGNTFISGSGFFLHADEAASLVARRDRLRFELPDDVAIGLMLDGHDILQGFSDRIRHDTAIAAVVDRIERSDSAHIRLEHFPVERAQAVWRYLSRTRPWRG